MSLHNLVERFYALWDSFRLSIGSKPLLFVDCGANIGQGYMWFRRYYKHKNVTFDLFEPNPYCYEELCSALPKSVNVNNLAVGLADDTLSLYGLADHEGGKFSPGGSLVLEHNNKYYDPSPEGTIKVNVIDFSRYIRNQAALFKYIVVKMDIEGYELDLLEKMISDGSISLVDVLYVEFHSQYQEFAESKASALRERIILKELKRMGVSVRIWH